MAESVRDTGGDALVVLDDLSCLNDFWDAISVMWHGFMDNEWKQQSLALDQEDAKDAEDAEDAKVAAEAKAPEAEGGEGQQNGRERYHWLVSYWSRVGNIITCLSPIGPV
jgi:hypothetical protein